MSNTTMIKVGESAKTITLPEGKALVLTGAPGTAGVAYLLDQALGGTNSLRSWTVGAGALAAIGPYENTQKIHVTCSAGSIAATVKEAVLTISATPAPTVPGQPAKPVLTAMAGAVSLAWTPGAAGSTATTSNIWTDINGNVTQLTMNPQTIAATAGTPYTGTVATVNAQGAGPASVQADAVTPLPSGGAVDVTVDVAIYGATWPGIAAAIAAKKQGRTVAIYTERNDIGGMVTAGIQLTDVYNTTRAVLPKGSLSDQLYARIAAVQSKTQQTSFFLFSYAAESKRALADINVMLTNAGITVVQNAPLTASTMIGAAMDTATFGTTKVRAKVWVDGSYTSDLYARTGGDYIIGAEAAATYSEGPQAGGFRTTGIQPAVNIDPYIVPGDSSSGLIKYVNPDDGSAEGAAVLNKVQFGGYRLSITNVAGQMVPFTAPSNYVASDFELHRRWFLANGQSLTTLSQVLNMQNGFPAIPSSTSGMTNKRDANNSGFVSLDYPDVADNIRIATPGIPLSEKLAIEERAKQYTLGLLYFYQNDASVPAALRADAATWGFCNDDYAATGRFPPRFYIREGLRAVGDTTPMAGPQMVAHNSYTNPIAFNYYAFDAHNRQFIARGGKVMQEGASPTSIATQAMSRVPMNLLFGKKAQASNVLLTWGGAESRIAYCATRVEPLMGVIGEAAGIVAALAVANNTAVQDVPYSQLAPLQNLFGNNVPGGCVISADGVTWTDGTVTLSGYTLSALTPPAIYGTAQFAACSATSGTNYIEYTPNLPAAGQYRVEVKYIDNAPNVRGTQTWTVTAGGVDQTPTAVTQTGSINFCGDWQSLGVFTFGAGLSASNKARGVHGNTSSTNGIAIRFVPYVA